MNEERRLFHVAVTRAKETCTVLCPAENGFGNSVQISRFLDDISSTCQKLSLLSDQGVSREAYLANCMIEELKTRAAPENLLTSGSGSDGKAAADGDSPTYNSNGLSAVDPLSNGYAVTVPVRITIPPVPHRRRPICPQHRIATVLVGAERGVSSSLDVSDETSPHLCCPVVVVASPGYLECSSNNTCGYRQKLSEWLQSKDDDLLKASRKATKTSNASKDIYGNDATVARKPSKSPPRTIGSFFANCRPVAAALVKSRPLDGGGCGSNLESSSVSSRTNSKALNPNDAKLEPNQAKAIQTLCVHSQGPECLDCAKQQRLHSRHVTSLSTTTMATDRRQPAGTNASSTRSGNVTSKLSNAEKRGRARDHIAPYKRQLWDFVTQSIKEKERSRSPRSRSPTASAASSSSSSPKGTSSQKRHRSPRKLPLPKGQQILTASSFFPQKKQKAKNDLVVHTAPASSPPIIITQRPVERAPLWPLHSTNEELNNLLRPPAKKIQPLVPTTVAPTGPPVAAPLPPVEGEGTTTATVRPLAKQRRSGGPSMRLSLTKQRRLSSSQHGSLAHHEGHDLQGAPSKMQESCTIVFSDD